MKKILKYLLFTIIIISVNACNKEDAEPENSTSSSGFTARINGSPFTANNTYCMLAVDSFLQIRYFGIQGYYNSEMISIGFMDTILTEVIDTNTTNGGLGILLDYEDTLSIISYTMLTSQLDFSKFDTINKKSSGTFSGILVESSQQDTLYITDGQFTNITYIWSHSH